MTLKRSDDYRYTVDLMGAEITPLASVEAFVGPLKVRVQNISQGGVALLFDGAPPFTTGDVADIAIAIRERPFPVQVEIKNARGRWLHCAFMSTPAAFQTSLQEYLQPKFLGGNMTLNASLSNKPDARELVAGTTQYDAYTGQNQVGFFVWKGEERKLLKLVGVVRDIVFEWTSATGLRTGRLGSRGEGEVQWDKQPDSALLHYFADILIAWFASDDGSKFVNGLMSNAPSIRIEGLKFPL